MENNTVIRPKANSVSTWYGKVARPVHTCVKKLFFLLLACGEHKRKDKIKNSGENNVTHSAAGPTCTSVVINDRFVLTSARCVEG